MTAAATLARAGWSLWAASVLLVDVGTVIVAGRMVVGLEDAEVWPLELPSVVRTVILFSVFESDFGVTNGDVCSGRVDISCVVSFCVDCTVCFVIVCFVVVC